VVARRILEEGDCTGKEFTGGLPFVLVTRPQRTSVTEGSQHELTPIFRLKACLLPNPDLHFFESTEDRSVIVATEEQRFDVPYDRGVQVVREKVRSARSLEVLSCGDCVPFACNEEINSIYVVGTMGDKAFMLKPTPSLHKAVSNGSAR